MENINTKDYWEKRFITNWQGAGEQQSIEYAKANVRHILIPPAFEGTILDFGCAMGDSIPVYKENFPLARLTGMDISETAIRRCKEKYGEYAQFLVGNVEDAPKTDVIIASHVLEHISDDKTIVKKLLLLCNHLFIFVPFKENPLYIEHVNYYDENYYNDLDVVEKKIFTVEYFQNVPFTQFVKNAVKLNFELKHKFSKDIIMFYLQGLNN